MTQAIRQVARDWNWEDTQPLIEDPEFAADAIIEAWDEERDWPEEAREVAREELIDSAERENKRRRGSGRIARRAKLRAERYGGKALALTFEYRFEGERTHRVAVSSFEEASRIYRHEIEKRNVGGSECYPTKILDERGQVVARVSYNGRVWPPGEWIAGTKSLYDPR